MANTRIATAVLEFTAEDSKLRASLENIQRENKKVGDTFKALGRDASAVFGGALEQKAEQSAAAIKLIGGATRLTDDEVKAHLRTLDAWIAKSKALGQNVSQDILQTRTALAGVNTEAVKAPGIFSNIGGSALKMAGALGIGFSIGAVTSWVSSTLAAAGTIDDLSKKLGVSAEAVQRWKFAAEQGGATIETVEKAVFNMNRSLATGDKSTVTALRDAGLSFSTLRGMAPEDAFNTIAEAVGKIEDPMLQARLATELFGKAGADLLPALIDGFKKTGDAADVMADATVKRLADAEDAWGKLVGKVTIYSGELIATVMKVTSEATKSWGSFFEFMKRGAVNMVTFGSVSMPSGAGAGGLTPQQIERDKAFDAVYKKQQADRVAAAAQALTARTAAEAAAEKAAEASKRAAEANAKALRQAADQISGLAKVEAAQQTARAVAFNANRGFLTMEDAERKKVNETLFEGIQASERLGRTVSTSMRRAYEATFDFRDILGDIPPLIQGIDFTKVGQSVTPMRNAFAEINMLLGTMTAQMETFVGFTAKFGTVITPGELGLPGLPKLTDVEKRAKAVKDAFTNIGKQLGSDIVDSLAEGVSTGNWSQFENQMKTALANFMGSAAAGAINTIVPGLGTLLQPLLTAISDRILGAFGLGTAGRDLVKDFAASFGGFDALRAQLNTLGPEGERLWIALTQGVGRNNPEQALAAIQRIQDALANIPPLPPTMGEIAAGAGFQTTEQLRAIAADAVKLWKYMRDSGLYSADQVQAAWERANEALVKSGDVSAIAADKARAAIAELKTELDGLNASVADEAWEEEMGVEETRNRTRIAQIEEEIRAKEEQIAAEIAAREEADRLAVEGSGDAFDQQKEQADNYRDYLVDLFSEPIFVPFRFGSPSGTVPAAPAARGGVVRESGIQYLSLGGPVFKPQGTDTVPAMLSPGEGVLNVSAMDLIGSETLRALNAGRMAMPGALGVPTTIVNEGDTFNANFTLNTPIGAIDTIRKFIDEEAAPRLVQLWEKGGAIRRQTQEALGVA